MQNKPKGCKRVTVDIPEELYAKLAAAANAAPTITLSEYVRRLLAGHFNYVIPSASERVAKRLRIDGKLSHPGKKLPLGADEC